VRVLAPSESAYLRPCQTHVLKEAVGALRYQSNTTCQRGTSRAARSDTAIARALSLSLARAEIPQPRAELPQQNGYCQNGYLGLT
jgi:hypothetical protein